MAFWGKLIEILDSRMETPGMYGWFHLTFFSLSGSGFYFYHWDQYSNDDLPRKHDRSRNLFVRLRICKN